ncbi:hypothetical protein [Caballeronia cordobensis]|uniref:hypothetical protein n=1 Tax=Caballeronia cordobensis TaxID=1353886 RepID=UPI0005EE9300|nr:hypothetical protein [Caballeronia cordobensis]
MGFSDAPRRRFTALWTYESLAAVETAKAQKMLHAWLTAAKAASAGEAWRTLKALCGGLAR